MDFGTAAIIVSNIRCVSIIDFSSHRALNAANLGLYLETLRARFGPFSIQSSTLARRELVRQPREVLVVCRLGPRRYEGS